MRITEKVNKGELEMEDNTYDVLGELSNMPSKNLSYAEGHEDGLLGAFRYGSPSMFKVVQEARQKVKSLTLSDFDMDILKSDLGLFDSFNGKIVPLDMPMLDITEFDVDKGEFSFLTNPNLQAPASSGVPLKEEEEKGGETFTSREDAQARANQIGCEGTHTHKLEDGSVIFMPCSDMAAYNEAMYEADKDYDEDEYKYSEDEYKLYEEEMGKYDNPVIKSLKDSLAKKAKEHNEKYDSASKKTTAAKLAKVYKRGVGAYRTNPGSVRPNVSSPQQWAMARVNSFLKILAGSKKASHDKDLLPKEHPSYSKQKEKAEYQGRDVPLSKPSRNSGAGKRFKVYVKNEKGNVVKVTFSTPDVTLAKLQDPKRRKAFDDRHNCSAKKDKTKAGYWACRLPRLAKALFGASQNINAWW
jgi:hypothetical protein